MGDALITAVSQNWILWIVEYKTVMKWLGSKSGAALVWWMYLSQELRIHCLRDTGQLILWDDMK